MSKFIKLFFLFTLLSCTNNKDVFWCGDHACVNKAEKKEYFKKNMVIEVRKIDKKVNEEYSKVNDIIQQGKLNKKNISKDQNEKKKLSKKEKRQKIKDEKKLAKQLLKQKRQRIKDDKKLARELERRERERVKNEKKISRKKIYTKKEEKKLTEKPLIVKKIDNKTIYKVNKTVDENYPKFDDFVKRIVKRSNMMPFPDIDIPLE